jgi:hypothetical protein
MPANARRKPSWGSMLRSMSRGLAAATSSPGRMINTACDLAGQRKPEG